MRIRKHAKISPLVYAASSLKPGTILQTHVCQLNQSPWDVMDFSPPSSPQPPPPPSPPPFQANGYGSSSRNGSSSDPIQVFERDEFDDVGRKQEYSDEGDKAEEKPIICCKTDGRSWKCRKEASPGNSMCEHHLSLIRNYANSAHSTATKKSEKQGAVAAAAAAAAAPTQSRRRARPRKVASSYSSNPQDYYYYSGFGPPWAKKRGQKTKGNEARDSNTPRNVECEQEIAAATLVRFEDEVFHYVEEEDEEEEDEPEESGRKRARKPIKARSLKSLM